MRFTTIFPETENVHLTKDVGIIPFIMQKEFGCSSTIVCYKNGEYEYLHTEVKGLGIDFIKKYTGKSIIDGAIYLLKNSKKIDILHLFHLCNRTFLWIILYKFLNSKGKIYLKLDANRTIKNKNLKCKNIKNRIIEKILKTCNLISVETKELYDYFNCDWPVKVKLIPNGFIDSYDKRPITSQEKENYIITVGRIGSKEKANEVLMQAFAIVSDKLPNWKVKFIGPIEEEFKSYINKYFYKYPLLKDRVIFTGGIYDKEKLDKEYRKAKIFCLTSPMEGFPLVFLEAIKNGCYIISSDVSSVYDVTNDMKYGEVFNVGDVEGLSKLLLDNCTNNINMNDLYSEIQKFAYQNFNWKVICGKIYSLLN
ncbi:glycosyltransferase family 4 protein [Clostridium sp.]|uniref:glycosyltransferase family 4 protein n=1 Tax=Clostridium sp. TaxID=1506 RepID=UPI002628F16E|nr:glycosyltransferase [Clostridium sp.]